MDPGQLGHHIKLLLSELGGSPKAVAAAYGGADVLLRIIEQPPTGTQMLRQALKFSGKALLHQDCSGYVFDCDLLARPAEESLGIEGPKVTQQPYLVAGVPASVVSTVSGSFAKSSVLRSLQVAPVSLLNAFEYSNPELHAKESFLLLDIGHQQSTVLVGGKGELKLVRVIDYGGNRLLRDLTMNDAMDRQSALMLAEQGDAGMIQACRDSLGLIGREVLSSIGYYEGRFDSAVSEVRISGGSAGLDMVVQVLAELVNLPCMVWTASEACELALPQNKLKDFGQYAPSLNVAIGAAAELLNGGAR